MPRVSSWGPVEKFPCPTDAVSSTLPLAYNCTDEENDTAITILRRRAWTALHGKIMEQLSDHAIMAKLRDRFEDSFRYDASGVPRVWTPNDDIDSEFRRAKEQVSVSRSTRQAGTDGPMELGFLDPRLDPPLL